MGGNGYIKGNFLPKYFLKSIYSKMLQSFEFNDLYSFWKDINFINLKNRNENILESIWNNNEYLETEIVLSLYNRIEQNLNEKGINAYEFIKDAVCQFTKGMNTSSKKLLYLTNYYFEQFHKSTFDVRRLIIKDLDQIATRYNVGPIYKEIFYESLDDWHHSILLMNYNPNFLDQIENINASLIPLIFIKLLAIRFGCPEYENVRILTDTRSVKEIIKSSKSEVNNNKLLINGKVYGELICLRDYYKKKSLKIDAIELPIMDSFLITKNYSVDGINLLRKGVIYSSPVILIDIKYKKMIIETVDSMKLLIEDVTNEEISPFISLNEIHQKLVKRIKNITVLYYDKENEIIIKDKKHIISGKPARILYKMLNELTNSGRNEFERKEFLYDEFITYDKLNPNLSIHFQRLKKALENKCDNITLCKISKGLYKLNVPPNLNFQTS